MNNRCLWYLHKKKKTKQQKPGYFLYRNYFYSIKNIPNSIFKPVKRWKK